MEGKEYSYKEYKENKLNNIPDADMLSKKEDFKQEYFSNSNYNSAIEDEILNEEYERYKNYLMLRKECPACHFIQGLLFTGIGFFCIARMHHFRTTFTRSDFLKLFAIASPSLGFGIYKFSYVNYIIDIQSKMNNYNKFMGEFKN